MEDRLQKFAQVVEAGSFTKAAQGLHISQPALTLAINKLERELRTSLLRRDHKPLELTNAGRIAYDTAREYRVTAENLRTRLTALSGKRPKIRIGMIDSVATALNGEGGPLEDVEARADVSITVNNSRYLRAAIENDRLDLAFAVHDPAAHRGLDAQPVGEELFTLVCRSDRIDTVQAELTGGTLADFISYDKHSTTYGHLHAKLREMGMTTRSVLHSTNPSVMMYTILRGRGVAALPCLLTKEFVDSGKLSAVNKTGRPVTMSSPIDVITRHSQVLPEAAAVFLAQAKNTLNSINRTLT